MVDGVCNVCKDSIVFDPNVPHCFHKKRNYLDTDSITATLMLSVVIYQASGFDWDLDPIFVIPSFIVFNVIGHSTIKGLFQDAMDVSFSQFL